jgi:hypothetical protein
MWVAIATRSYEKVTDLWAKYNDTDGTSSVRYIEYHKNRIKIDRH